MIGPSIKELKTKSVWNSKIKRSFIILKKLEHSRGDSNETWKIFNSALGRRSKTTNINSLVSDKGDEVTCPNEMSNMLNNHFATIADKVLIESEKDYHKLHNGNFQQGSLLSPLDYLSKIRDHGTLFQFSRITADDVLRNAANIKTSKSGTLPGKFLKDTIYVVAPTLAFIFNWSLEEGIFPDNFKIARICPIYKGKGSKSNPDNYRPISVLSVVARLFGKLVYDQLLKHLERFLYVHQSGFRPKHSTETSLLNTTNRVLI